MSVDRELFVSDRWDVQDVQDALKNILGVTVKYEHTHSPDYAILLFTYNGENRQANCHVNYDKGGFKGLLVTLGAWGSSEFILKELGKRFGGFYQPTDSEDKWEEIQYTAGHNLEYLLHDALKEGKTDGRDVDGFIKYLENYKIEAAKAEEERRKRFEALLNRRGSR